MQNEKEFILTGNLKTIMWRLSWPSVVAMVLYGLNSFLDGVFVGQLMDSEALAGVGIAFPLTQITLGLGSLVGTGAGTALSIWIGADQQNKLQKMLGTVNGLCLALALLVCVPMYFLAEPLVQLMGATGQVLAYGTDYFRITSLGSVFWIHGLALNMVVRGEGKMKTAAWIIALGLVVDVSLKPIFIRTLGGGVEGAAWATNIGMLVYSLIGIGYFAKGNPSFQTRWNSLKIDGTVAKEILKLGFPGMLLTIMGVVQSLVVLQAITSYGTPADLPFFTTCSRILMLLMMPVIGLMRALQPVAGMNYGAGNYQRVIHSYWLFVLCGFCIITPFWLIITLFPSWVIQSMLPGVVVSQQQLLDFRLFLLVLPLLPMVFMCLVTLPSIEKAKETSILALLRQVIFYFPLMIVLPRFFGVSAIYWGSTLIDAMVILISLVVLMKAFSELTKKIPV